MENIAGRASERQVCSALNDWLPPRAVLGGRQATGGTVGCRRARRRRNRPGAGLELEISGLRRTRAEKCGLFLDRFAIRFSQRHAKFHTIAAPRITDRATPQSRTIELNENPLAAVSDVQFCAHSPANQIGLGVPPYLELALAVQGLQLDRTGIPAALKNHGHAQKHQARRHHGDTRGPSSPVRDQVSFHFGRG